MNKIVSLATLVTIIPLFANQIHDAINNNKTRGLIEILKSYKSNREKLIADLNEPDKEGHTSLYLAVKKNNLEIASLIVSIAGTTTINFHTHSGKTPLYEGVANHSIEMTQLLLSNGAAFGPVSFKTDFSEKLDALYKAVKNENLYLVKLLIFCGAPITDEIKKFKDDNIFLLSKIKDLINHPEKIKEYCSEDEIKEFEQIKSDRYACFAMRRSNL